MLCALVVAKNKPEDLHDKNRDKSEADDFVAQAIPEEEEYNGFYTVRGYEFGHSPDKLRDELEKALNTMSFLFREHPTLPANPADTTQPLQEAFSDECGLLLPRKHCAFSGCGWNGHDAISFTQHIDECHRPALAASMQAYKALKPVHNKDEITLALSIYNEGIATAIRRGAPLASYSIDRKCLLEYNKHLIHNNTGASVCFTCARKFPPSAWD